jgi:hypothetical protein
LTKRPPSSSASGDTEGADDDNGEDEGVELPRSEVDLNDVNDLEEDEEIGLTARAEVAASKAETAREAAIEVFMISFFSCRCGRNVFETFCEGSIGEVDGGG